jgi:L-ascorbate metabolism protein UlaG (beta-lactamase superfamily)
MIITFQGNHSIKLQFGDTVVAANPISKDSSMKGSRFGADICLVSVNNPDFNGVEQVSFGDKQPLIITGPGEYETSGVFIRGLASHSAHGINTIYTLNLDSINICILGALDSADLPAEAKESLEEIDILFLPIGGNGTLAPQEAYKLAVSLEPKLIIPLGYDAPGAIKDALKIFLKEAGEQPTAVDKLTIKRKDLDGKEGDVAVLACQS